MEKTKELVNKLTEKHGTDRKALIPILQGIVKENSFISKDEMIEVAKALDISGAEVYGTASFYSFLEIEPRGKYVIRVCRSIVCDNKNKGAILRKIEEMLHLKLGETSADKKFSLLETNCLGQCDKAPAMLINDDVYTELTPDKVRSILHDYLQASE
ncbi:MAG: NADH-quinone oxidoreductase subunit NuoE [Bacteroidales bacterium]|nr:NADH-quinone oxidoreductase subunit NuoE [Bacteroidales bacterium]